MITKLVEKGKDHEKCISSQRRCTPQKQLKNGKGGGGGKYEQYCKFAGRNRQNRQKSEADNEADQGCHVTRAKDEQSIPSTDYSTK